MTNRKKQILITMLFMLMLSIVLIPSGAMAFDVQKGAKDTLDVVKIVVVIIIAVSAITAFMKHQIAVTVSIIVVGCILLAATTPGVAEKVGAGIIKLVGGE